MAEIFTTEKRPGDQYRGDLHHARMTLLPIIAEGGNSWHVAMQAVRALWRMEFMVKRLIRESEFHHSQHDGMCEEAPRATPKSGTSVP